MNEDTHPYQQSDPESEHEQEERKEQEEQPKAPPSRLDRLMSAKDKAEKEAARWSEIEKLGKPLPSHDQLGQDVTQPYTIEPVEKEDDTPVGQETPSQPPPPADSPPPPAARQQRPAPPFPHPTDQPTPPAPAPRSPESLPHPTDSPPQSQQFFEPPMPEETDQADVRRGVQPSGGQPHRRYQPPPDSIDEVRIDANGMPLPRRVPLEDADATLVGESAYRDDALGPLAEPTRPSMPRPQEQPSQPTAPIYSRVTGYQPVQPSPPPRRKISPLGRRLRFSWGCVARVAVLGLVSSLVVGMLGGGAIAIYYAQVTAPAFRGIRSIDDLQQEALQFQTTRIRDIEGNVLYELNDPNGGFRDYVTLDEVSPWVIVATVATEERLYFTNPGFSIPAMTRAVIQAYREGRAIAGTSTITQQLTRALLLEEEERTERSYERKVKEIFLAGELARRFSKQEILELYLNQIYYGNLAYGIEAAAQTYFNKSARDLTMAEASFLVGLPQAPALWDPVTDKEAALERQSQVLTLMVRAGCIDPGNSGLDLSAYCVDGARMEAEKPALEAIAAQEFHAPAFQARYPHWVVYVQQLLEDNETVGTSYYTAGYDVYTTLDPRLQDLAQDQVNLVLSGLTERNVTNASVVIIDPHTGAILAMVGSKDFDDETIDGQVNVALTPQQPGSSIKPFTYLTAFRQGWTPSTVIWDVPIVYEIPGFGSYEPVNYDGRFHGPIPARVALANSYNIPAVQTLDYVGVPALLQTLNDVGISSLGDSSNPNNFGLSLTLGAGEVYLLEWTNAFATLANGGQYHPPYAIQRIELNGEIIQEYEVPEGQQVLEPDLVYLLTSILSDTEARVPAFGSQSPLSPPYPAAAKTGTTNDFRDNWTMGFLTDLAVGVWVGNTDNSPMIEVSGVTGAGPIWRGVMDGAQQWYPARSFPRPPDIIDQTVCSDDGALPSPYCTEHAEVRTDVFASSNPPPPEDQGLYRELHVDQFTGLIANEYCTDFAEDKFFVVLPNPSQYMGIDLPAFERDWLLNTDSGRDWATRRAIPLDRFEVAPTEACKPDTPQPTIVIDSPQAGSQQKGVVTVTGTADAPDFSHYKVEFGVGDDPLGWGLMQGATAQAVHNGPLAQADLSAYSTGLMTIRVIVYDNQGHRAERRVVFSYTQPTPTPQPTSTTAPTQTATVPPTATSGITPTATVAPSEEPTVELTP